MRWTRLFLSALPLLLCALISPGQGSSSPHGGTARRAAATGWFRTFRIEGRWWLVDPDGRLFLTVGVESVSLSPESPDSTPQNAYREVALRKYGGVQALAVTSVQRLKQWNFNTLGARSDRLTWRRGLPYTVLLDLSGGPPFDRGQAFPDVFAPGYARGVAQLARRLCRPLANDRLLVGYFTDDNLHWRPDQRSPDTVFSQYLGLDDFAPGRRALLRFLQERYPNIESLNQVWRTAYKSFEEIGRAPQVGATIPAEVENGFLKLVAEQYFKLTQEAIRSADPNHLILGCRFAGGAPTAALEAMRGHVDVVSIAGCGAQPPLTALREIYRITQRPILLTGFNLYTEDSGTPGREASKSVPKTEAARGAQYARYVAKLMTLPMVIGYHWHRYTDQPPSGGGGEGSPTPADGLVSLQDEPHPDLAAAVSRANQVISAYAAGRKPPQTYRRRATTTGR